jgi:hypothetical protein
MKARMNSVAVNAVGTKAARTAESEEAPLDFYNMGSEA